MSKVIPIRTSFILMVLAPLLSRGVGLGPVSFCGTFDDEGLIPYDVFGSISRSDSQIANLMRDQRFTEAYQAAVSAVGKSTSPSYALMHMYACSSIAVGRRRESLDSMLKRMAKAAPMTDLRFAYGVRILMTRPSAPEAALDERAWARTLSAKVASQVEEAFRICYADTSPEANLSFALDAMFMDLKLRRERATFLCQQNPKSTELRSLRATLLCAAAKSAPADYSAATKLVEEILRQNPNNVAALVLKSRILRDTGKFDEGQSLLKRAIKLPFRSPRFLAYCTAVSSKKSADEVADLRIATLMVDSQKLGFGPKKTR